MENIKILGAIYATTNHQVNTDTDMLFIIALSYFSSVFPTHTHAPAPAPTQHVPSGLSAVLDLSKHKRISPDTYHVGRRQHPHKKDAFVDGYAFLNLHRRASSAHKIHRDKHHHFKRNLTTHEHISSHTQHRELYASLPTCTGPIAEGAAWHLARGYQLHTLNRNGMTKQFVVDAVQRANDAWSCGMNTFDRFVLGPLLGVVDESSGTVINTNEPDGVNEIGFASIQGHEGTVAVTIVWGVLDGPLQDRVIVEFDMIFDGEHYQWGDGAVDRSKMDLQAICTHETGHRLGLDDIYDAQCSDVTMFGTSAEGEIDKRTLTQKDIGGLSFLYGLLSLW